MDSVLDSNSSGLEPGPSIQTLLCKQGHRFDPGASGRS